MTYWGVSAMSHDAALAVYQNDKIVYASHGERYSRIKNDQNLHADQISEALQYGRPERVFFYENTTKKKTRQARSGQYRLLFKESPSTYMKKLGVDVPVTMFDHHYSHAAYGYYSSGLYQETCDVLVIDSIGEFETISVWRGRHGKLHKAWSQDYPHSVGLWYSAMTQRLGLKPQEHEYILMGMAALGDPGRFYQTIRDDFFECLPGHNNPEVRFRENLHRGCLWWRRDLVNVQDYVDIAAAVQKIYEEIFVGILSWMSKITESDQVAIVGGCALNCVANTLAYNFYERVWIPPNPGDAGSSIGAIMAALEKPVVVHDAYLGTEINGEYPFQDVLQDLEGRGISAVASGPAEFGPRALGHRSILADPRLLGIKDQVNKIKQREEFRPFAPMILREHAARYFHLPRTDFDAPYMQYAIPCISPQLYPGITHIDGTSRVQTVDRCHGNVRTLLERWYERTGCPMLLNTSLNIKGEPLVNTREDAERWSVVHGLAVRTAK